MPTANIEMTDENKKLAEGLIPGVYAAVASFMLSSKKEYMCALSIGWNPTFDNDEKTIEAFLIHDFEGQDFYDEFL